MEKISKNKTITFGFLASCWLLSGFVIVPPNHEALVYENSTYQKTIKDYGWHLPAPFATHAYTSLKIRKGTFFLPNNLEANVSFDVVNSYAYLNNGLEKTLVFNSKKDKELPANSIEPVLFRVWDSLKIKQQSRQLNYGDSELVLANMKLLKEMTQLLNKELQKPENSQKLGIQWKEINLKFAENQNNENNENKNKAYNKTEVKNTEESIITADFSAFQHLANYKQLSAAANQLKQLQQKLNDTQIVSKQQLVEMQDRLKLYAQEQESQINAMIHDFQEDYRFYTANPNINGWRLYRDAVESMPKEQKTSKSDPKAPQLTKLQAIEKIGVTQNMIIPSNIDELMSAFEL